MKSLWLVALIVLLVLGASAQNGWGSQSTSVGFGRNSFGRGRRASGYHHIRFYEHAQEQQ